MQYLRQNTAVIVAVGPFLDKTDGVTLETSLTITNERISLVAETDDNSAPTLVLDNVTGATSGTSNDLNYITGQDNAMMQMELSAANTNRLGRMRLTITDAANHCPVFHDYFVLPPELYDQMAGTSRPRGIIIASGTLGATGNSTTALHLANLAYADDDINGNMIVVHDVSTGLTHSTWITDWANTGDLATVPTLPFTPQASTDTYVVLAIKKDPDTATILADTNDIQTRLPAALVSGRIDASVGAMAANVMTAAAAASDLTTELQSGLATAAALDTVDNFLDTEVAAILAAVDTEVAAIKAKTDLLNATDGTNIDVNVQKINDVAVVGAGTSGNKWRA